MLRELKRNDGYLDHYPVVSRLLDTDRDLVYTNENGGWAIDRVVLAEFRKLTEGRVVWSRSELRWRPRDASEDPKRRIVE